MKTKVKWVFWDFSGLRFIWSKVSPPEVTSKTKPPSTFFLWILGIYVALFGIASQRYENRVDRIENRTNAIFTQLSTDKYKSALGRIARVQTMTCPYRPTLFNPSSVFRSLFGTDYQQAEIVEMLKETLEDWKDALEKVDLTGVNLEGANLKNANLRNTILSCATLEGANLGGAHMEGAILEEASLENANIVMASLKGTWFRKANLKDVILSSETLDVTFGLKRLAAAKTLYKAKLDPRIREELEKIQPSLFEPRDKWKTRRG